MPNIAGGYLNNDDHALTVIWSPLYLRSRYVIAIIIIWSRDLIIEYIEQVALSHQIPMKLDHIWRLATISHAGIMH